METNTKAIEIQAARLGWPVERLLLAALNEHPTMNGAAEALGVSYRTLYRYVTRYGIGSRTVWYLDTPPAAAEPFPPSHQHNN